MRLSEERLLTAFEEMERWVFGERTVKFAEARARRPARRPPSPLDPDHFWGVGIGLKQRKGIWTEEVCVRVFVSRKLPRDQVPEEVFVPPEVRGVPTDVIAVGSIRAFASLPAPRFLTPDQAHRTLLQLLALPSLRIWMAHEPSLSLLEADWRNVLWSTRRFAATCSRRRHRRLPRPVPCGVSIGHFRITAGTLGYLVCDSKGRRFILSNNHVLADNNAAKFGDPILQPGPFDGGKNTPSYRIAQLSAFVPINFNGRPNSVDAAIAETDTSQVQPVLCSIGTVDGIGAIRNGLLVQKHGRTTGRTQGLIVGVHETLWVDYDGKTARFDRQLSIAGGRTPFSDGGDSGSLIVDLQRRAIGLLFAGSDTETYANPIRPVLRAFKVRLFGDAGRGTRGEG
ncbi:MAG: hypothetical protein REDVDVYQ_001574 [Candidatus Fervidibacter sp.]